MEDTVPKVGTDAADLQTDARTTIYHADMAGPWGRHGDPSQLHLH